MKRKTLECLRRCIPYYTEIKDELLFSLGKKIAIDSLDLLCDSLHTRKKENPILSMYIHATSDSPFYTDKVYSTIMHVAHKFSVTIELHLWVTPCGYKEKRSAKLYNKAINLLERRLLNCPYKKGKSK